MRKDGFEPFGEIDMSQHVTVFGVVKDGHRFGGPQQRAGNGLALWGLVLAMLLLGVTAVAAVTATAWAQGAFY
jgi:hypothetical protein